MTQHNKSRATAPAETWQVIPLSDSFEDDDEFGTDDALSLAPLREAFRQVAENVVDVVEKFDTSAPEEIISEAVTEHATTREIPLSPRAIVEAMLFVGDRNNEPLSLDRAAELMRNVTSAELLEAVYELEESYRAAGSPYTLTESKLGGWRLVLRPEFESLRNKFYGKVREATLSQKAIDTLAIIAYRQPVTLDEVQKLRGEPSGAVLTKLLQRDLIATTTEKRQEKRVAVYRTTERFLQIFSLVSLDDLPQADEIDFR